MCAALPERRHVVRADLWRKSAITVSVDGVINIEFSLRHFAFCIDPIHRTDCSSDDVCRPYMRCCSQQHDGCCFILKALRLHALREGRLYWESLVVLWF